MKSILILVDNTNESKNAVDYAAHFAEDFQLDIILLNAYQLPISYSEVPLVNISLKDIETESKRLLEGYKKRIETLNKSGVKINIESVYGQIEREVLTIIDQYNPTIIVIGTKGTNGIGRLFWGSTSKKIIDTQKVPVLIIPPIVSYTKIKSFGLATDFEDVRTTTRIDLIKRLAITTKAKLSVLHVDFERGNFKPETPMETMDLDSILDELKPTYCYIENKKIVDGINKFVVANSINLLVVYPKKHSWFEKLFEQSTTRELIHNAVVPVLCMHN